MKIERERHLNASHYERNELRADHANGFKAKRYSLTQEPLTPYARLR
jgi:hypothetical protein